MEALRTRNHDNNRFDLFHRVVVGQQASEFVDELHDLYTGLKAILTNAIPHDFAALSMYYQAQ